MNEIAYFHIQEVNMKINIQNFTITTKSETCVSKNGNPLSEYSSYQEAFDSAEFQKINNGIELIPYNCSKCSKGLTHVDAKTTTGKQKICMQLNLMLKKW